MAEKVTLEDRLQRLGSLEDLARLAERNTIARMLLFRDQEQTRELMQAGLREADQLLAATADVARIREISREKAESLRLEGVVAYYQGRYSEAVTELERSLLLNEQIGDTLGKVNGYCNLAMVYRQLDDFGHALEAYERALDGARTLGQGVIEANTLGNIGILYYASGELETARTYITAAWERTREKEETLLEMTWSSNLAELHLALNDLASARPLLDRAMKLSEANNERAVRCDTLRHLGTWYLKSKRPRDAVRSWREARDLAESFGDSRMVAELTLELGRLAMQLPTAGSELCAESELRRAVEQAEQLGVNSLRATAHEALAQWLEANGKFDEAYGHLRQHAELAAKEHDAEMGRKLRLQRSRFEMRLAREELADAKAANTRLQEEIERRREAEASLHRALADARRANEVKARFLAMISHEIRTPMNAILGLADWLRCDTHSPEQAEAASMVSYGARNLLEVINGILDVSELESSPVKLTEEDFSLAEVIENTVDRVQPALTSKRLQLTVNFPPSLNSLYRGDSRRLGQILFHLLDNAVKYTERGGVGLEVAPAEKHAHGLIFDITDTGAGIPEHLRETIFEQLISGSEESVAGFGGTGLGLTVAQKLTELMGGSIRVEEPIDGQGTHFRVELPLSAAGEES
jgi:signal transduction histidine kinase/Flp pilus assembly protein TadD